MAKGEAEAANKATEKAAAEDRAERKKLPGPLRNTSTGKKALLPGQSQADKMTSMLRTSLFKKTANSERDVFLNMILGKKGYNLDGVKTESTPSGKIKMAQCAKKVKEQLDGASSGDDEVDGVMSNGGLDGVNWCGPPCCDSLMQKRLFPNISPAWAKLRKDATAAWYDVRRKMSFKGATKPPLPGM